MEEKKELRIFAGEFKDGKVEVLYPENPKGFSEGDFVIVLHGDDYLSITESLEDLKRAFAKKGD